MKIKKRKLLLLFLLLAFLGSGGYILFKNLDYRQGAEDYEAAVEAALPPERTLPDVPDVPDAPREEIDPYAAGLAELDLDALREVNPDVTGWIEIPETELSYPIVQGEDNAYYLNHTWNDGRSAVGAVFMEQHCSADFSDYKTILYGHRMRNGSMFGSLRNYGDTDYWREHPDVYIADGTCVRTYRIFAAFEAGVRDIVYRLDVEEEGMEDELIGFCLTNSVLDTGVVPESGDPLLTLSTCTGRGHATRWVVLGVLKETYRP